MQAFGLDASLAREGSNEGELIMRRSGVWVCLEDLGEEASDVGEAVEWQ